ncbi:hypothetical protein HDU98_008669 [Podochytrium sp. JEL0797]|nr:hypothetical protein HDU98_008669 [Podochytrium sp. JEL0797]
MNLPGTLSLIAAGALLAASTAWILLPTPARPKGSPPLASHALPIVGHLFAALKGSRVFFPLAFEGQDCDIVEANVLGKIIYIVRGREGLRSIFSNSRINTRAADPEGLKQLDLFEKGIAFNNHVESWKHNRKLLVESVGRARFIRTLARKINEYIQPVFGLLDQLDESKTPILANILFGSISLDVNIDILFSVRRHAAEAYLSGLINNPLPPDQILVLVREAMGALFFFFVTPPLVFKYIPGFIGAAAKHFKAMRDFETLLAGMIQQKSNELESNANPSDSEKDLVSILCQSKSPTRFQDALQVVKEAVSGGIDSSSNTMSFLTYELAKNPKVADRVCQEILELVGETGELDSETVGKLPLLEAAIHEGLRLHSIAQFILSELTEEVVVGEIVLKKGKEMWLANQMNHVSPKMWEDSLVFRPSRFLESKSLGGPLGQGFAYAPFGAGVRKCPGEALALMEMKLVMASLIRRYKFVLVNPSAPLLVKETFALQCQDLPVFFQRRERA